MTQIIEKGYVYSKLLFSLNSKLLFNAIHHMKSENGIYDFICSNSTFVESFELEQTQTLYFTSSRSINHESVISLKVSDLSQPDTKTRTSFMTPYR